MIVVQVGVFGSPTVETLQPAERMYLHESAGRSLQQGACGDARAVQASSVLEPDLLSNVRIR